MTERAKPATTIAVCATLQAVGGGLGWSLLPPLMPTIAKELGISHAMGGVVWGAASLGIALASPFGGAAVDRYGARRVAAIAMIAGALACASRAAAIGPWTLAATMLVFGMHIGFVAPAIPKALAGHVALSRLGRANGIALLAYTLGTAVTVLTAPTLLAPLLGGWRACMVAASGAMLVAAAAWYALARDRGAAPHHADLMAVLRLADNKQLLRVAAMHFLLFGGYLALLGMLPRAMFDRGLAPAKISLVVACWLGVAGVANFAGPWLSERIGRRRPILVAGGATAGLALLGLAFAPDSLSMPFLALAAIGGGCVAPLLFAMPAQIEEIGPSRAGAALGLLMLVGQAGGFLLPAVSGAIAGHLSTAAALAVLALLHLAVVVPALGVRDGGREHRRDAARDGSATVDARHPEAA